MIKSLTVTNHLGESLTMGIGDPDTSGLLISNIDGISPGQADISTTELAAANGAVYNSSRLVSRSINISMIFMGNPSIEDSRQLTYRYFPLGKHVVLSFETNNRSLKIDGYVESNEADVFDKQEGTTISIVCPNPYFYNTIPTNVVFSGIEPMFEFPFCNDSLTENLLVFSEIRFKQENAVYNPGDAETGFTINIHFIGPATNIKIMNVESREVMAIDTIKLSAIVGSNIKALDDLIISTVTGKKSLEFWREGVYYNVLNCLDRNSDWLKLERGMNIIAFTSETGNSNLQFEISFNALYEGV